MTLPSRTSSSTAYRYGFQGQEKDDELKGEGNSLNYTFRMHDPRVGRFFATDPLTKEYPELTPYQFASNSVIDMIEIEGLEDGWTVNSQGQIGPAALGPITGGYFNSFYDAYSAASLNIQNPSSFYTLKAYARTPSVQIPQAQVRGITFESHQKQYSSHYLAAHDPTMKAVSVGLLGGAFAVGTLEAYGAYTAWFGTTGFAETVTGSGWIPALQSQFSLNAGRTIFIGGGSSYFSQYVGNGFTTDKMDYGDVAISAVFGGNGGLFMRSLTNITVEDVFTINSVSDTALNFSLGKVSSSLNKSISASSGEVFSSSAMGAYMEGISNTMVKTGLSLFKKQIKSLEIKQKEINSVQLNGLNSNKKKNSFN
ncbi:hypothetical protein FIA58_020025 [Flavobacterium jejuense]|uniref:RHS repeat-associated core domain-containing protein n=1 Tax=Flavobacterium jejuense TaxID=1544455 RepID=A0ABX0IZK3_9FLAO|nr:hypothetical protein [Flavobacterium jejuense]